MLLGVGVGLVSAVLAGRWIAGLLFQVRAADPAVLAGASAVLALAGLFAVWLPARRATRADPLGALSPE